jgi:hypothetical protein
MPKVIKKFVLILNSLFVSKTNKLIFFVSKVLPIDLTYKQNWVTYAKKVLQDQPQVNLTKASIFIPQFH